MAKGGHVHLLVGFPPKVPLVKPVNSLKDISSRWLRQEFPDLVQHYWGAQKLGSASYFAGAGGRGAPPDTAKKYIDTRNGPARQERFTPAFKGGALSPTR